VLNLRKRRFGKRFRNSYERKRQINENIKKGRKKENNRRKLGHQVGGKVEYIPSSLDEPSLLASRRSRDHRENGGFLQEKGREYLSLNKKKR